MSMRAKFSELPSGACFDYRGRVYRKLRMNLAEDEERVRALFPSEVEVLIVEMHRRAVTQDEHGQVIKLITAAKAQPVQGAELASGGAR